MRFPYELWTLRIISLKLFIPVRRSASLESHTRNCEIIQRVTLYEISMQVVNIKKYFSEIIHTSSKKIGIKLPTRFSFSSEVKHSSVLLCGGNDPGQGKNNEDLDQSTPKLQVPWTDVGKTFIEFGYIEDFWKLCYLKMNWRTNKSRVTWFCCWWLLR